MANQRKLLLYIATSLDGYIATEDDELDWLFRTEGKGEGDNGYSEFYETVDTILMGRRTYDWIMEHEYGHFPYNNKECFVFSNTINGENDFVRFVNEDVVRFVEQLKGQEGQNIWLVGGGDLLHIFLKEKLVDELIITVAPATIGKGIPLFKPSDIELALTLKKVQPFDQMVQLHYEIE